MAKTMLGTKVSKAKGTPAEQEVDEALVELTPAQQLEALIPQCYESKQELAKYKKESDTSSDTIKQLMSKEKIASFTVDGCVATLSVTEKDSFNDDLLISKLKELKATKGIVKKREYVDMDALENAIYHGEVNAADLAACKITTSISTLRIKAESKKKEK